MYLDFPMGTGTMLKNAASYDMNLPNAIKNDSTSGNKESQLINSIRDISAMR